MSAGDRFAQQQNDRMMKPTLSFSRGTEVDI